MAINARVDPSEVYTLDFSNEVPYFLPFRNPAANAGVVSTETFGVENLFDNANFLKIKGIKPLAIMHYRLGHPSHRVVLETLKRSLAPC